MWITRLHNIPDDKVEALLEYCHLAQLQDSTFKFTEEGADGKVKYVTVESPTRNIAFRRGVLFHHRFKCYFEVEWRKENVSP